MVITLKVSKMQKSDMGGTRQLLLIWIFQKIVRKAGLRDQYVIIL